MGATTIPSRSPSSAPGRSASRQLLRHVMVVGGNFAEWRELGDQRWASRVADLGSVADHAEASFLTIRAFEQGADAYGSLDRWERSVGDCRVVVDPCGDGRERFADALSSIGPDDPINEATVAEALYAPADCEPDLIVVLGSSTRLPPSLVWELAYGELVFVSTTWDELAPGHLVDAIADFAQRDRRFGGIDPLGDD